MIHLLGMRVCARLFPQGNRWLIRPSHSAGKDVITGFTPGATATDVVKFAGVYADFASMLAVTQAETGVTSPFGTSFTGTVIGTGADQIWLSGVTKAQLNTADFIFA